MRLSTFTLACSAMLFAGSAYAQQTTLTIGMASADAGRLDPHVATTTPDKGLLHYMFNGLVRIAPGQASPEYIEPDIAESWTSSEDGLTWTFSLRDDVACHGDWGMLSADDVVFSLERAANPDTSAFAGDFSRFRIRRGHGRERGDHHPVGTGAKPARHTRSLSWRQHCLPGSRRGHGRSVRA